MTQICKLLMVTTANNNKYYNMTDQGNGQFLAEYGRVDAGAQRRTYPMSKWESTKASKIKKGYKDVTHLTCEEEPEDVPRETSQAKIADTVIHKLFDQLQAYANKTIQANYKISSKKVTQAMIDEAQDSVNKLAKLLSVKVFKRTEAFNEELLTLFHIIPRKMQHVGSWIVDTDLTGKELRERSEKLLGKEQATLDVMAGQVLVNGNTNDKPEKATVAEKRTILDILGLEVVPANDDDIKQIKKSLGANSGQFRKGYKVVNKTTQAAYDAHMKTVTDDKVELFWHGSRNENWLNIMSTGLLIRPSGAVYSGSMFGDGIYFADKAQKSIGYTSLRGSYWASGSDNSAYLALFSVHVGNQHTVDSSNSSLNWNHMSKLGTDSTYAKAGRSLRNNEYIIYRSQQCTILYLVEISS